MGGTQRIANHTLPPAGIIFPGVQPPKFKRGRRGAIAVGRWWSPGTLFRNDDIGYAINQTQCRWGVAAASSTNDVITDAFFFTTLQKSLGALGLWSKYQIRKKQKNKKKWDDEFTSKSACLTTSSARIRFRINSASLATRTMWSFMAWESSLHKQNEIEEFTSIFFLFLIKNSQLPSFVD